MSAPRPERVLQAGAVPPVAARELPLAQRLAANALLRKALLLVVLALAWEGYARTLGNPLLLPSFSATVAALVEGFAHGGLGSRCLFSLQVLLVGYSAGLALAGVLAVVGVTSVPGRDLLETLTSMFSPLPAIALLPLALLWFGLGTASLVAVLVHSVVWPVALNTHAGFLAVSPTLRMVGRNYGLRGLRYVGLILIPAAFPSILTGLKIGWAFAWRTLIAAELVFGVSSGSGGLGWFIYENKNQLEIPSVFAGLLTVTLIGLLVEGVVFRNVEARTVRRWGMHL